MNNGAKMYLYRLLVKNVSCHRASLIRWMRHDEFAERIQEMYQSGITIGDKEVLQLMQEFRAKWQSDWRQNGRPYPINPESIRSAIRSIERATDSQSEKNMAEAH